MDGGDSPDLTFRDDPYYERVASMLSRMKDGETFRMRERVTEANREKFLACFKWFAGVTHGGPWWWEWDDECETITKHEQMWYKEMKANNKNLLL